MLLQPLDWSLMVPARLPTPCKSTKSRLPDAEITKGRRSLHLGIRRSTHCCNSVKFANLGNLEAPKFSVRPNSPCTKIVNCCFRGQVIFSLFFPDTGRRMHTVINMYIGNLAMADVIIAVFCIPFQFQAALLQRWDLPAFMCKLCPFLQVRVLEIPAQLCFRAVRSISREIERLACTF